jgi:hypothetical protein
MWTVILFNPTGVKAEWQCDTFGYACWVAGMVHSLSPGSDLPHITKRSS